MTDLEIMYLLEEEGFEPSVENLKIIKEECLEEGFHPVAAVKAHKANIKKVHDARRDVRSAREIRYGSEHFLKSLPKDKRQGSQEEKDFKTAVQNEIRSRGEYEKAKGETRTARKLALKYGELKEDVYSDYELYQILEESGYKTTEKNLDILKEGLESGKYEILDETIGSAFRLRKDLNSNIKNMRWNLKHNLKPQHKLADSIAMEHLTGTRAKDEHDDNLKKEAIANREKTRIAIETQIGDISRAKKERNKAVKAELRKKY